MDKNRRIQIKLILILIGIIVLAVLAVVNVEKVKEIVQKQGEYIPRYQALLLFETVDPDLSGNEEYQALKNAENDMLTYAQYMTIYNLINREDAEFPTFEKEYQEEHFLTKKDFEEAFALFLEFYDPQHKLTTVQVTILGSQGNIILQDQTEPESGMAAAVEGLYEIADEEILKYRFQTVEAYIYEKKLITVKQETDTKFYLENIWNRIRKERVFILTVTRRSFRGKK